MKKIIYIAGSIATFIATVAATVTIYDWYTDDTVSDTDDVVHVLERVLSELSEANDIDASTEDQETINRLLIELSGVVSNAGKPTAEQGSYLRVASGAFVLPLGQSADVEIPDGGFSSVGFPSRWHSRGSNRINVAIDGKTHLSSPGDTFTVSDEQGCEVLYVGPIKQSEEVVSATFRFRCGKNG